MTRTTRAPKLTFLGHAGYAIDAGAVHLLVDPWLEGSAFDNGWDLVVPSEPFDASAITHIWFSHEHPDHFSIPAVKSIPVSRRSEISVLFQRTADKRVVDFLRKQGFTKVREVTSGERVVIGDGAALTTVPVPREGDSCHLLELDDFRMINFNDCFYPSVADLEDALALLRVKPGTIDLMATQFSYASWVGNASESHRRRAAAKMKLDHLAMQVQRTMPRYTLPFASFVYFSHEENAYLNDSSNPPARAVLRAREAGSTPVLARPGDAIELTRRGLHEAASLTDARAAELGEAFAAARAGTKPMRTSAPVPLADLAAAVRAGLERLRAGVSKTDAAIMSVQLPRATFALRDQPFTVVIERLEKILFEPTASKSTADVVLSSEALKFAFSQDFGFDTLLVNGRFQEGRPGGAAAVMKLCGQFSFVRRKQSLVKDIVRRRFYDAPRRTLERLRHRAIA